VNFTGTLRDAEREYGLSVTLRDGVLSGSCDGTAIPDTPIERRGAELLLGKGRERAVAARDGSRLLVHVDGRVHEFEIVEAADRRRRGKEVHRRHAGDDPWIASPMTGVVTSIAVKPGDAVPAGGTLAVVEAMKMQFVVRAPRDVVVKSVRAEAGKPVDIGAVLVEFEEAPAAPG
jgi:biotin carboxyl carrier protein